MTEQQREDRISELVEALYERNAGSFRLANRLEAAVADRVSPSEFAALQREAIDRFNRRAEPVTG